jgi:hypothetical protein
MAKVWDEKHAAMRKSDATMKKNMMSGAQFSAFMKYFMGPGQIGGQRAVDAAGTVRARKRRARPAT